MQDGERLMGPGEFLKTFGSPELELLFEKSMDTALYWLKIWDEAGLDHLNVSINVPVSVLVLPLFADRLAERLERHQIAGGRIYLELLETQDDAGSLEARDHVVRELGSLGVKLVMDDLGSGYSSLTRLRTIPFHTVKIDQNLVKDAALDPERSVPFIRALIQMAHVLGQEVVVEGLQSLDLIEMAACLGAGRGQGYAIAHPMLAEDLLDWLQTWEWTLKVNEPQTPLGQLTRRLIQGEMTAVS
jgi:EAL domain-containing protein (putative c-di-GMP-specific phosphodiesterase class I)